MKSEIRVTGGRWQVTGTGSRAAYRVTRHVSRVTGFTLVEILVTMVLLSLIVLALMTVFNSTQKAFRASLTETDLLESGRLAMGLMVGDLEGMTPSSKTINTNIIWNDPDNTNNNVNFTAVVTSFASPPSPLYQSLIGVNDPNTQRTNVLESFFSLSRQNISGSPNWVGTGYLVSTNSPDGALYPLYRFYLTTNVSANPAGLFNSFNNQLNSGAWTNWSHLMDGVVALRVRAYDPNGFQMTNLYDVYGGRVITNQNTGFLLPVWGEVGFYMYSNTVPASVEVELGVLEDTVLRRAEAFNGNLLTQTNYLAQHAGQVHLFRQRVLIRNVDPTAYQ
jgi:prepilin-type N-terminal cleavage/methylation domain-containing protein